MREETEACRSLTSRVCFQKCRSDTECEGSYASAHARDACREEALDSLMVRGPLPLSRSRPMCLLYGAFESNSRIIRVVVRRSQRFGIEWAIGWQRHGHALVAYGCSIASMRRNEVVAMDPSR